MNHQHVEADVRANPFCTRYVRPGAIPFQFPVGESPATLIDRLRASSWRGAIVGPHGSGKSTLLATLLPIVEEHGWRVAKYALHDGQRYLPRRFLAKLFAPGSLVVVDGYEQLGCTERWRLCWHCWRRELGLLVTSHRPVGLPVVFRTTVTLPLAQSVVSRLQEETKVRVGTHDVACAYSQCGGNVRELLFRLFDLYEARQRTGE